MREIFIAVMAFLFIVPSVNAAIYQQGPNNEVIIEANGTVVPDAPTNPDWQRYQAWVAQGNAPDPESQPTLAQQASSTFAQKLSAGLAISCASNATVCTSGITGTYATTAVAQANIVAIGASIASGQGLPGSGSTFQFADIGGALHTFTSAQFLELAAAVRDYVYQLDIAEQQAAAGQSPTWPTADAMIQ